MKTVLFKSGIEIRLTKNGKAIVKCEEGWITSNLSPKDIACKIFGGLKYDPSTVDYVNSEGVKYFRGTAIMNGGILILDEA